ncbi:ABC transporter [Curtobacterium luteum]|uniref:ABC transporter n=1 Tax=Curtobacterium luteum TaxID=33881 RepID=A0A175RI18_9MICO|nr:ABC transporter [Curtobacterium luteum]
MLHIDIDGLSFAHIGGRAVFRDLRLHVPAGRTVVLGPNGAGKSTLLNLIGDALRPSAGRVRVSGIGSPSDRRNRGRYRRAVALLPQQSIVTPGLTVREHVAYQGWLQGLSRRDAWARSERALATVDLADRADDRAQRLSGGQTRRMGLAGALVGGARLLLLDEPTAGLDPAQRARFADIVQSLPTDVSVVVSTHQTEDVLATYGWIVVMDNGGASYTGTVASFTATARPANPGDDPVVAAYARLVSADD